MNSANKSSSMFAFSPDYFFSYDLNKKDGCIDFPKFRQGVLPCEKDGEARHTFKGSKTCFGMVPLPKVHSGCFRRIFKGIEPKKICQEAFVNVPIFNFLSSVSQCVVLELVTLRGEGS